MSVRSGVLSIIFPLLVAGHTPPYGGAGQTQGPTIMVRRAGLTGIVRISTDGRAADTLYRSNAVDVHDLTVAPSGRFVAALEVTDRMSWANRLIIVGAAGEQVRVVDRDVRTYVWCCGGEWIAAVTGTYVHDAGFMPTGAYLIDVEGITEQRLELPDPRDVVWAAFDQALYFKIPAPLGSRSVIRYDPRTKESRLTEYRDIRFSPSGAFYLHQFPDVELGPPGWHIFERETGREVARPDTALGGIEGWVFGEGDYLQLKRVRFPQRRGMLAGHEVIDVYTIYDVARGVVAATIHDSIRTDVVAPAGILVLAGDGALKLVRGPSEIARE